MYDKVKEKNEICEKRAFADLATIIDGKGWETTGTHLFSHYDAILTNGEKKIFVELKRREIEIDKFSTAIVMPVYKALELKKIEEETGINVWVLVLYPKSNKYIRKKLDDLMCENQVVTHKVHKEENDENSPMILLPCYDTTISKSDVYNYISNVTF